MRIALLVPDGVGIRNFVLGRLLKILPTDFDAVVFHTVPDDVLSKVKVGLNGQVNWRPLNSYRPSRPILALQYSLGYAQMYWADTVAMRRIRNGPMPKPWKLRALHNISKTVGRMGASPYRMHLLENTHYAAVRRLPEVKHYEQIFAETKPDVVFCSDQRSSAMLPAVLAARKKNIPTATFIASWDNLSSKGRIVSPFDHYLVWSRHMAAELQHYYPCVPADRIHVVGTPQFENYADSSLIWTREEFFGRIHGDPNRPLLCYSGGDASTCPEDPEHVRVLMELVRSNQIRGNPQVLVRPVPVDDGRRYQRVRERFPDLLYAQPQWMHSSDGNWSRVFPTSEDIQFLANLTHHADININLGSTMTLDFGIHDKPVVNVAFDVASPPIFGMPVWDFYYFFEHYRPVMELGAARPARSADQLAEFVNAYLDDPSLDREGRRRLFEMQVSVPLHQSSHRILDAIRRIGNN